MLINNMLIEVIKVWQRPGPLSTLKFSCYSAASDSLRSFFAAMREGMRPANMVNTIEIPIRISAALIIVLHFHVSHFRNDGID